MASDKNATVKSSIRDWWASNPMTYGFEHGRTEYVDENGHTVTPDFHSRAFFDKADEVFYQWNEPRHTEKYKFGKIFDYDRYRGKKVLEIGCGMGCMAMNWAKNGAEVTAVDLNPVAVSQTRKRFELHGLTGEIREADAENLPFEDGTFDFVYSWGVLHHTPGTPQTISELYRVLKPGGRTGVMLYNRNSFLFRYQAAYIEGFLNMERMFLSDVELGSRYGDGERDEGNPHTWPVTHEEIRRDLFWQFKNLDVEVFGTDVPWMIGHWWPGYSGMLPKSWMAALARRYGWSLWITGEKQAAR
jgi:2-polyprenyl-3-methyl-5-hydroxy-6-metoxy-1,4-benzoquinol methylase